MNNLIVELKQHTPIIHFQAHQNGATLRASDVKPRLTSFLGEKLHYKLKIESTNRMMEDEEDKSGLFFGNISSEKNSVVAKLKKKKLLLYQHTTITINSYFDMEVLNKIKITLPKLLAVENFGTRSDKGFGSFFPTDINEVEKFQDILLSVLQGKNITTLYHFETPTDRIFPSIKKIYYLLKSGYRVGTKMRSFLESYCEKELGFIWDKKSIKDYFFKGDEIDHENNKFIRGLFGLSKNQNWKEQKTTLLITNDSYDRIPSPLYFKIFNKENGFSRIYFWSRWNDKYDELLGENFLFDMFYDKNEEKVKNGTSLQTPEEFNIDSYLAWAIGEYNGEQQSNRKIVTITLR